MSLFNMMLSGGGSGGGFKTATPTSSASASVMTFEVDSEPREYIIMLDTIVTTKPIQANVYNISMLVSVQGLNYASVFGTNWAYVQAEYAVGSVEDYVTTSYSNGIFSATIKSNTNQFNSTYEYTLFYK